MRHYSITLALLVSVWTYGGEALDTLIEQSEWQAFSSRLQCEVRNEQVWCLIDGQWETIKNEPLDPLTLDYYGDILNYEKELL